MADFTLKQGDRLPELTATLTYGPGGGPIVINGGAGDAIEFQMRSIADSVVVFRKGATIVDGPNGKVKYSWATGDTAATGSFYGEWIITFNGGKVMTVPGAIVDSNSAPYMTIEIYARLG